MNLPENPNNKQLAKLLKELTATIKLIELNIRKEIDIIQNCGIKKLKEWRINKKYKRFNNRNRKKNKLDKVRKERLSTPIPKYK